MTHNSMVVHDVAGIHERMQSKMNLM